MTNIEIPWGELGNLYDVLMAFPIAIIVIVVFVLISTYVEFK